MEFRLLENVKTKKKQANFISSLSICGFPHILKYFFIFKAKTHSRIWYDIYGEMASKLFEVNRAGKWVWKKKNIPHIFSLFSSPAPFLFLFFSFQSSILPPEIVKLLHWGFFPLRRSSSEGFRQNIRVILEWLACHHVESLKLNLSLCSLCLMCLSCRGWPRVSRWKHETTTIKWDPTEKLEAERIETSAWEGAQLDLPLRIELWRSGLWCHSPEMKASDADALCPSSGKCWSCKMPYSCFLSTSSLGRWRNGAEQVMLAADWLWNSDHHIISNVLDAHSRGSSLCAASD